MEKLGWGKRVMKRVRSERRLERPDKETRGQRERNGLRFDADWNEISRDETTEERCKALWKGNQEWCSASINGSD